MAVYVTLEAAFPDNKSAQEFSGWLYQKGYTNKTLFQDTVSVTLRAHGDRVVVMEEVDQRGGRIIENIVEDDD